MAAGQLDRHGVMPITWVRGKGGRMEAHMDHAWLMTRSHAHGGTRVHSGELGVGEVAGDDNSRGDDEARSRRTAGSRGSKVTGMGAPRKAQRTSPPTPLPIVPAVTPLPKWQICCSSSTLSRSGSSGLCQWGGGPAATGEAAGLLVGSAAGPGCGAGGAKGQGPGEGAGGTQTKGTNATAATAAATSGGGDGGGGGLVGPLWCSPGMAATGRGRQGELCVVGSTVGLLLSQQAGGGPLWKLSSPTIGRQC